MEPSWNNLLRRRGLLRTAGVGAAAAGALSMAPGAARAAAPDADVDILNFALNLEYLEAEFYSLAVFGQPLDSSLTTGSVGTSGTAPTNNTPGTVTGGSKVPFTSRSNYQLAYEIAQDEMSHVALLRSALAKVPTGYVSPQPAIDLVASFTAAAQAAGVISAGQTFNPFLNENSFLLAAFIFEDVGVSAYAGAAPLITSKGYLSAAARILGTEAYHAAEIRTRLYLAGYAQQTDQIAAARAKLSGTGPGTSTASDDVGVLSGGQVSIVDADAQGLVFTRTTAQVLNIVYLGQGTSGGGFFPNGVNGNIVSSAT